MNVKSVKLVLNIRGFKMITIYGKTACSSCIQAKQLLTSKGVDYEYKLLGTDYSIQEFYEVMPRSCKTFPAICIDGKYLGGLVELKEVLVNQAH